MIFGTQYIRGDAPYKEDWERDLKNIENCGFNTIRAFLVWSHLETADGVINFEYLDNFFDEVEKTNLKVGLMFHLVGAPYWLTNKHKEYWYVDAAGTPWEPSSRSNTPSGGWPGLCYDHNSVWEYQERFMTAILKHLSKRKSISFWEPMNEPHQETRWTTEDGLCCYCNATRANFRIWLQKKYKTIEELSRAWSKPHTNWADVNPPTFRTGFTDVVDFRLFMIDRVVGEVKKRTELIKKYDNRPVMAHSYGGSCVTANLGNMANDDWKQADVVDMWGCSGFPFDHTFAPMIGLSIDVTRSAANGKEYWQSELYSGDRGHAPFGSGRMTPEQLELLTWESIRHGAKGMLYWQYRKERQGAELRAYGLTDYDGGPTENLERVSEICKLIQKNQDLFDNSDVDPAQVAILFSPRSYLANYCAAWAMGNNNTFSTDCLSGYYKMFWEENITVDILHEEKLENIGKYKLVILPQPSALHSNTTDIIKEYVKNGGTILSDPSLCVLDNDYQLTTKMPGQGFDEVFGCEEIDLNDTKIRKPIIKYKGDNADIKNTQLCEYFRLKGGKAVALYAEDEKAAIVVNQYGKGTAILSGLNLGYDYSPKKNLSEIEMRNEASGNTSMSKNIVLDFARQAGVEEKIKTIEKGVAVSLLLNESKDDLVFVINNNSEEIKTKISLVRNYKKLIDLKTNKEIPIKDNVFEINLSKLQSMILKAEK